MPEKIFFDAHPIQPGVAHADGKDCRKVIVEFCFAAATDNEKAAGNRELLVVPVHQEAGHERHEGFSLVISQCIRFDFASLPNGLAVRGNIETVFGKSGYREKGIILVRCIN